MTYYHGHILIDDLIGPELGFLHHIPGDGVDLGAILQSDVYCHVIVAHVEATVGTSEEFVKYSGKDVLAGMALHTVETPLPVEFKQAYGIHGDGIRCVENM